MILCTVYVRYIYIYILYRYVIICALVRLRSFVHTWADMIGFTVSNRILDVISCVPMCGNGLISFVIVRNKTKKKNICHLSLFVFLVGRAAMHISINESLSLYRQALSVEVFDAVESVVLAEADFRFTLMFYPIVTWIHLWRDCRKGKKKKTA